MEKIFQLFSLDQEEMSKDLTQRGFLNLNLLDAGKKFIQALREKGYEVRISSHSLDDLPVSLIVVAETDDARNTLMPDFLAITARLNLPWYRAGEVYS